MGTRPQEGIDPKIAELIRIKVNKMFGADHGHTREDREDAEQEMWLQVETAMKRYDPRRASWRTFASRIVTSKLATLAVHTRAQKHDRRRVSAHAPEDLHLVDVRHRPGAIDTSLDVREVISRLPAQWGAIATLFEHHTEAEVMKIENLSRQRVRTVRQRIDEHLRAKGLAPESSTRATNRRTISVHNKRGPIYGHGSNAIRLQPPRIDE